MVITGVAQPCDSCNRTGSPFEPSSWLSSFSSSQEKDLVVEAGSVVVIKSSRIFPRHTIISRYRLGIIGGCLGFWSFIFVFFIWLIDLFFLSWICEVVAILRCLAGVTLRGDLPIVPFLSMAVQMLTQYNMKQKNDIWNTNLHNVICALYAQNQQTISPCKVYKLRHITTLWTRNSGSAAISRNPLYRWCTLIAIQNLIRLCPAFNSDRKHYVPRISGLEIENGCFIRVGSEQSS